MGIYEKYKWFQQGIVKAGTTEDLQALFKTKLSEEQVQLLDRINKRDNIFWLAGVIAYFIAGLAIGWLVYDVMPHTIENLLSLGV